jgi:hypothetical protein
MPFRQLATAAGLAALALDLWGLLPLMGAIMSAEDGGTDSSPLVPCRPANWWYDEKALSVTGYSVDFVPLRFVCETKGGGSFVADAVPGYVNPGVVVLALVAVGCRGAALFQGERPGGRLT